MRCDRPPRLWRTVVALLVGLLWSTLPPGVGRAAAQLVTGTIVGSVSDEQGGVMPGVAVSISSENLIFLGIPHTSRWLEGLLESCNFQVESNGESIVNSRPRPGEPARFARANHSPTRSVTPHLFAVLPGRGQSTRTLVLTGQTSALASYLMSPSGIDAIHADWMKLDRPDYVEVVVLAETEGDTLVKASLAGFRAVQPTR